MYAARVSCAVGVEFLSSYIDGRYFIRECDLPTGEWGILLLFGPGGSLAGRVLSTRLPLFSFSGSTKVQGTIWDSDARTAIERVARSYPQTGP